MTRGARLLVIVAGASILLFAALGRADLFNPDEPREAELAREMWAQGDLLVPRLNGQPFLEKPPLFYWLVSGTFRLAGGPGEVAARLVPAIAALLGVLFTYLFGRRLVGEKAAALGALVLLTSMQFFWVGRRSMIDMPLTLAVLVSCAAFHRAWDAAGRSRLGWLLLASCASGCAVMLKGVVGAAVPALALLGFFALRRDGAGVWRCGLIPGMLAALLPVVVWTAALDARLGPWAAREFAWVNNVLRFTGGAGRGHENPAYYYLPTLFLEFAPWSLALPFALVAAWRSFNKERDASLPFLLAWFLLPLAVLSIASTKRGLYLLPIYPAAALLVGWWLAGARPSRSGRLAGAILLAGTVVVSAALLAAFVLVRPGDLMPPVVLAAVLVPLGVAAYRALRAGRLDRQGLLTAAMTAVLMLGAVFVVVPAVVNRVASAREAGAFLRRLAAAGDRIALYQIKEGTLGGYLYYAGMMIPNLETPDELQRHLDGPAGGPSGSRPLAFMQEETYGRVASILGARTQVVRRFMPDLFPLPQISRKSFVLVAAVDDPGSAAVPREDLRDGRSASGGRDGTIDATDLRRSGAPDRSRHSGGGEESPASE